MIEQAGSDRVLLMQSAPEAHVQMKFPEYVQSDHSRTEPSNRRRIMNNGSPYNVPAGQVANMDKVIAKYKQLANEDNERKLQALRDDEIKSEQPWERFSDPGGPGPSNRRWPSKGVGSV